MATVPQTAYARSADAHIAYQVVGDGPVDLVIVHGIATNIDLWWESPTHARFLRRLARFSRLIPDTRLLVLAGVGHYPWLEVPERFFDDVNRFLDSEWPSGAEPIMDA